MVGHRAQGRHGGRMHPGGEVGEPAAVACENGDDEEVQMAKTTAAEWKPLPGAKPLKGPPTPVYGSSRMLDEPTLRWRAADNRCQHRWETPAKVREAEGYNGRT